MDPKRRPSTSKHTSFMHSAITQIQSVSMEQQIVIAHRRYVCHRGYHFLLSKFLQGELEHRRVKRFYATTNKVQYAFGIAKQQRRERLLFKMNENLSACKSSARKSRRSEARRPRQLIPPDVHYYMSPTTKNYGDISSWVADHSEDHAYTVKC